MKLIESKLPHIGTTIFTEISSLSQQYNAINIGQGFPDFDIDPLLSTYLFEASKNGYNQYAPMPGYMPLRETLANVVNNKYNQNINPESEITITAGGTQALFNALSAFIQPNDEVIVFDPAYDSYAPVIQLFGGKVKYYTLQSPDFKVDWHELEKLISKNTKAIVCNNPHNPLGTVFSNEDMLALENIVLKHDLILISDEVYEHIIFDNAIHRSVLYYPNLYKQSIVIFSFGKTFHTTGWKIGYSIAPSHLTKEMRKVHQYVVFSVNTPTQVALSNYLKHTETLQGLPAFYEQKRNYLCTLLKNTPFNPLQCAGTYFQLVDFSALSQQNDKEFAIDLIKNKGVATIPLSSFYSNGLDQKLLRICFAKKESTLEAAVARLTS